MRGFETLVVALMLVRELLPVGRSTSRLFDVLSLNVPLRAFQPRTSSARCQAPHRAHTCIAHWKSYGTSVRWFIQPSFRQSLQQHCRGTAIRCGSPVARLAIERHDHTNAQEQQHGAGEATVIPQ